MKARLWKGAAAVIACAMAATVFTVSAQGPIPNLPLSYSGQVFIEGQPTPDGLQIFARILDYETALVEVKDGRYSGLVVAPTGTAYTNKQIVFYATLGFEELRALETALYRPPDLTEPDSLTPVRNLHFTRLPTPPPTPTPTPTPTPIPTATLIPTPTMTPTPTAALPIPGDSTVGTASLWVLVAGVVGLMVGFAVLGLARSRTS